jgi:hypothetical protein
VTASDAQAQRPGLRVGSASEFTLFFRVIPGHAGDLREALTALQNSPGYRPGGEAALARHRPRRCPGHQVDHVRVAGDAVVQSAFCGRSRSTVAT